MTEPRCCARPSVVENIGRNQWHIRCAREGCPASLWYYGHRHEAVAEWNAPPWYWQNAIAIGDDTEERGAAGNPRDDEEVGG